VEEVDLKRRLLELSVAAVVLGVVSGCDPPAGTDNGLPAPSVKPARTACGARDAGVPPWCVPVTGKPCNLRRPVPASVSPDTTLSTTFARYAASTPQGWTGGDSTYSVRLPDGRIVWLFSDTFLGPLARDGSRPANAKLVNNSFVVQNGDHLDTVVGGTPADPAGLMPPPATGEWYWVGDGQVVDGQLQVAFQRYRRFGNGFWQFTVDSNVVAMFAPDKLGAPASVDPLPSLSHVAWGAAILPASRSGDGYTYIYGMGGAPIGRAMRVARVRGDDLRDRPWWYYTPSGWTQNENAATDVLTSVANEYSVTPWRGQFLLVTQAGLSGSIDALTSCTPWGPFTNRTPLYRMPEPGATGTYHDAHVFGYNAHVHAELSSGNTFLVSYNVHNVENLNAVYRDPTIYRPRFIRVRL
jgi:hypothetical protein